MERKNINPKLMSALHKVNPEAAEWLRSNYFEYGNNPRAPSLSSLFVWRDTPQGHEYWKKLNNRVGGTLLR